MNKPALSNVICILFVFCAATAIAAHAQTLTTLFSFDGSDGNFPYAGLIQASDGNFYGSTVWGGANCSPFGCGTVFKITPSGTLTTLYNFCSQTNCADGNGPYGTLIQASDGNFYGTTSYGGANCSPSDGCGTVFKITPSGTLTTLYSFCSQSGCPDGLLPSGLVQASDGNFYGATASGGASAGGTVFKITPSGALTTIYSFCSQSGCPDGSSPNAGPVQATDGDFYGTTGYGGASGNCEYGCGTVFRITSSGALTTLYSFSGADGESPDAALIQATDRNFYGTTFYGGAHDGGTVFKITPSGTLTTLHSFNGHDGANPISGLVQASDGNFYGTTYVGGAYGQGTAFQITPSGTLTRLYSFCTQSFCVDGDRPYAGLVQGTDKNLYGATQGGGAKNDGTVFRLAPPRPCVVCPTVE